jgi:hypothetical protein
MVEKQTQTITINDVEYTEDQLTISRRLSSTTSLTWTARSGPPSLTSTNSP